MSVRTLPPVTVLAASRSTPFIAIAIALVALGFLFQPEVTAAFAVWQASTAYNHCFLVIPIVAYLIWDRRDMLYGVAARPYPLALLAGLPLALAWLFAERLGIMEGRQLVALTFAELLFFVVLGPRLWWLLAGPLLYLYFLVPFGAFLTPRLQDITTVFVTRGLPMLGIPATIRGYTIEIPEGRFLIAEACAGLRFLIASIAFGCLYALAMYRSPVRRAVFIAISIVVPVVANGIRALGIVALGHYLGSAEAVETDHVLYGWIFFSIVIVILIALGLPFRQDQIPRLARAPRPSQGHRAYALLGAAMALLLLAAIGPAAATRLDRRSAPETLPGLPEFVFAGGCSLVPTPLTTGLDAPGRLIVRRFDCGDGLVTLNIEVFSAYSTASRLVTELRRLVPAFGTEDVETAGISTPDTPPGTWQMIGDPKASNVAATSLWIDGEPARLGMSMRARLAWRSVFGGSSRPVLMVVVADGGLLPPDVEARRQAAARIASFLQRQPALPELASRLAGDTD